MTPSIATIAASLLTVVAIARGSSEDDQRKLRPMLAGQIERPLRYMPDGGDFLIVNGAEFFNRPLYGGASDFRVDAGDRPEFSIYLPGKGGNLRLGIVTATGNKWLHEAARIEARYRAGSMLYQISDPLLGSGTLRLTVLSPKTDEGLLVRVETDGVPMPVELVAAFGGISGVHGDRGGDIGCEGIPVSRLFQLKPQACKGNAVTLHGDSFVVRAELPPPPATGHTSRARAGGGSITGLLPQGARIHTADAGLWNDMSRLLEKPAAAPAMPLVVARLDLPENQPAFIALQHSGGVAWKTDELPVLFGREEQQRGELAGRVTIDTPDPFLNAAMPALNVAADAVWDDRRSVFVHGGVAWRLPYLGFRLGYAGDALGWHDRSRAHFIGYAAKQNTSPLPQEMPAPEASANLSRNLSALHSNGDMNHSLYNMNTVGVDTFFRHLLWTGDLEYARKMWPVIERHLAWERRLFRREFGPEKLPIYEGCASIWASDALGYNGGGASYASAYHLYHSRMAARVAKLLGIDPAAHEREAELILEGMRKHLWLADRGWYAEFRDLLGMRLPHPNAAAWTFYHTIDSEVPTPIEAWQMSRYVDTRLPRFPLRGPGVPEGGATIATTDWMPYVWSLNNVAFAETVHTSLGLWQAGRSGAAYPLLKGALLDSMYLGLCPGNLGMCTWFDTQRRESQRDFADGVGILPRAVIEGLFGITPDLLDGTLRICPGFPADWDHARIHHPEFDVAFAREVDTERFTIETRFPRAVKPRLVLPALRDSILSVAINGKPVPWKPADDAVGNPRIEIEGSDAARQTVEIRWSGKQPMAAPEESAVARGSMFSIDLGLPIAELRDPQGVMRDAIVSGTQLRGLVHGTVGHRSLFARVSQGALSWLQPVMLEVREAKPAEPLVFTTDWSKRLDASAVLEPVALEPFFNDRVSRIFRNEYLSPRSPYGSLAVPKHGIGTWCHPAAAFDVDDSGLRKASAGNGGRILLPNGAPLTTPSDAEARNIAFVSQWDNFPRDLTIPLAGRAAKAYLLMAGSTNAMQSRIDNGEIVVTYTDGTTTRLALENPSTWWPIDQDYFIDDFAFARPGQLPPRVDLKSGKIRLLDEAAFKGQGRIVPGGAATVLDLSLDPAKELKSLTVRALANEVVIGLMSATLQRP